TVAIVGNTLVIDPAANFIGDFYVRLSTQTATTTSTLYHIFVTNTPPSLAPIDNQTMPTTQDTLVIDLHADDPDPGDTVTFTATAGNAGYILGQRYGLNADPHGLFQNAFGANEKWFRGLNRDWYVIKPN